MLLPALLGGIGSSASGIIVTAISQGRKDLRSLFGRLRQRASPVWYALALVTVPVMLVATLSITGTALDSDSSSKISIGIMIGGVEQLVVYPVVLRIIALGGHPSALPAKKTQT